ncbi:hypothetical protein [Streptomyces sp. RTd22]|uniref:hypothetical protein n=1 Tax=Streptomyces sp. RTd22 TaxID=1841249 RepID=UPI0007C51D1B|nr:hypothetical protein [Streptomyces sp. RTd22]
MIETRPALAFPPGDGHHEAIPAQVRDLYVDLAAKHAEPADPGVCRGDYATGASERAAFDARARSEQEATD